MLDFLQNALIYGGSFVLVLSVVVFVHEQGHFQAARFSKVAVEAFSIGFGKALASWTDREGVRWKIGAAPLGGYVKFVGDANEASAAPAPELDPAERARARSQGLFHAQPVGVRAWVVAAGPLANFVFAILAFALLIFIVGKDVTDTGALSPRVDQVQADSPAARAGLAPGDVVRSIDGRPVETFAQLGAIINANPGRPLAIVVDRSGEIVRLTATPETRTVLLPTGVEESRGALGIGRLTRPEERRIERLNPLEALAAGAERTWSIIALTVSYLGNVLSGKASAEHLSGPLGILDMSGQVAKGALDGAPEETTLDRIGDLALALLSWAAILSVAVGFVNLLPIPVLDGGHLLFYAVEAARGRPLSARAQDWGFRAGLAALAALFLFATWNDISRFLQG